MAVLVAVDLRKSRLERPLGNLGELDRAAPVGVLFGRKVGERIGPDALFGIAAGRPAGDVQRVVGADDRGHVDQPRQAGHGPELAARLQVVAHDAERARHDDLRLTADAPDDRRGIAARKFAAVGLPNQSAVVLVEAHQGRVGVVILIQDQPVADQRGAAAGSEIVLEGTHGHVPQRLAFGIVGEQPTRTEEADHQAAVGHGAALGPIADLVDVFQALVGRGSLPEDFAVGRVERDGEQCLVADRGQKDPAAADHRRRVARRERGTPAHVLLRPNLGGILRAGGGHAGGVGPAKLRPAVLGRGGRGKQRQCQRRYRHEHYSHGARSRGWM